MIYATNPDASKGEHELQPAALVLPAPGVAISFGPITRIEFQDGAVVTDKITEGLAAVTHTPPDRTGAGSQKPETVIVSVKLTL